CRCLSIPAIALDRIRSFFPGTDAYDFLNWGNKDLPVADLSRLRTVGDHFNYLRRLVVRDKNLDLHLRQKIHRILRAAIKLGMSFLAAETFDLPDSHPLDPGFGQSFFNLIQLEWLNNRFNHHHANIPLALASSIQVGCKVEFANTIELFVDSASPMP